MGDASVSSPGLQLMERDREFLLEGFRKSVGTWEGSGSLGSVQIAVTSVHHPQNKAGEWPVTGNIKVTMCFCCPLASSTFENIFQADGMVGQSTSSDGQASTYTLQSVDANSMTATWAMTGTDKNGMPTTGSLSSDMKALTQKMTSGAQVRVDLRKK